MEKPCTSMFGGFYICILQTLFWVERLTLPHKSFSKFIGLSMKCIVTSFKTRLFFLVVKMFTFWSCMVLHNWTKAKWYCSLLPKQVVQINSPNMLGTAWKHSQSLSKSVSQALTHFIPPSTPINKHLLPSSSLHPLSSLDSPENTWRASKNSFLQFFILTHSF